MENPKFVVVLGGTYYGHRIFVCEDSAPELRTDLNKLCIWGGSDKTRMHKGKRYVGYEFNTNNASTLVAAIGACVLNGLSPSPAQNFTLY